MCGIWAMFGVRKDTAYFCNCVTEIAHRGPDSFRMESIPHFDNCYLAFYRLAIIGNSSGMQPLHLPSMPHLYVMYNGEIYNYKSLGEKYGFEFQTSTDGEAIVHLYAKFGAEKTAQLLDGVFAFVVVDTKKQQIHLGRDTFGVRPMFVLNSENGRCFGVSSEVKGLLKIKEDLEKCYVAKIEPLLPGHYCSLSLQNNGTATIEKLAPYTTISKPPVFETRVKLQTSLTENVRNFLKQAVRKRLISDRRIGCLLSGGLDSSLVTACVVQFAREEGVDYPVQTFSIGMEGSPDLASARKVADHLQSEHHEIIFTPEEGISILPTVIKCLESYDIITVRGSVCMYLLCKYIRENTDTRVLFSGEGADELAQGYIYFHQAPNAEAADKESQRLLQDIHLYDVLRADRCTAAHGLELRVPMLDKSFTSYYLSIPAEERIPQDGKEKFLLRSSFENTGLIPIEILWRQKEGFSDGVSSMKKGSSWYEILQKHIDDTVPDAIMDAVSSKYSFNSPKSKEAYYYRKIFDGLFPEQHHLIPYMWMPKWSSTSSNDPSQRALAHYKVGLNPAKGS